ncbi:multidrug efflux MFS transporter [Amycolatopsis rubida]|uniref:Multidrug efflux MFS transporter n=1 Tax=Amycolatopsis rubida TaxID=112413 RepID=A0ABX0C3B4_9PSEU|nr:MULTISPECIES: DHA2 family efflux MFS transporter permease subunit [Amycolatopsis]MYW94543.1 DHA2 family efflux MFS transporter permease subunit [Amycolatopsis rubida]NEC59531.1 multidrug efflux MFS transporter [Amycolatopsis rubida]OAP27256.1 putative transport protein HsrA [Amycolatopsis sp. M39]
MTTRLPEVPVSDSGLRRLGGVLILGAVLSILDATIVSVGIGVMARDLDSSLPTVQWVASAYLLAASLTIPLSGWLADRFGGAQVWIAAVGLFTLGTVLCGFAWSAPALIAFRVLHGLGGGLMQPIGQAIFAQAAGPRLGRMIGVVTLPATVAPVLGPMLGGALVQDLGWRWLFFGIVPFGVATLLLAVRVLPREEPAGTRDPLDVCGLLLLPPGLGALGYGLGEGSNTFAIAGAVLLIAYAWHARRAQAPLLDLKLFAHKAFTVASASTFLLGASLYSSMLLLPLYYQQIQHTSALAAGLLLAPQALGSAVVLIAGGKLLDRFGSRTVMLTGIALSLGGTIAFTQLGDSPSPTLLTVSLLIRGFGLGATTTPGMTMLYTSLERSQIPRAASAINVVNRIGGSLGTALLVAVLHAQPPGAAAFGTTFTWALGLSLLSFVPALFFPKGSRA